MAIDGVGLHRDTYAFNDQTIDVDADGCAHAIGCTDSARYAHPINGYKLRLVKISPLVCDGLQSQLAPGEGTSLTISEVMKRRPRLFMINGQVADKADLTRRPLENFALGRPCYVFWRSRKGAWLIPEDTVINFDENWRAKVSIYGTDATDEPTEVTLQVGLFNLSPKPQKGT